MLDRKMILNISLIIQLLISIIAGINCYKNTSQILPNILSGGKIYENCAF